MPKTDQKHIAWTEEMVLSLLRQIARTAPHDAEYGKLIKRWTTVARRLSQLWDVAILYRSAKARFASLVCQFKATDNAQRLRESGSAEEVTDRPRHHKPTQKENDSFIEVYK
ncbi:hypothetical protein Ae201684P_015735 [Aphanomyces euteiches]|uniref:Myb/SANT-like domain-containing protein n=1 Tax=Aphanomyces euteiches TaxID=100861 RepID=A0A6G0WIG9_9STRA|nr:hypothetical protein Ae201684_014872 [Aphanomyces euteiches]KAH9072662.1 hypothetical protein Ae201684P_015735 [Aphanomyces euteiches]